MRNSTTTFVLLAIFLSVLSLLMIGSAKYHDESIEGADSLDALVSARTHVVVDSEAAAQPPTQTDAHPLDELLVIAREIKLHIEEEIVDYTATMVKRERIGGKLGGESRMLLKVRNRSSSAETQIPLAAYVLFTHPSSVKGREVIWVEGMNDNRLISHEAGMFNLKRFHLEPTGMLAMIGNKYPVTEIGILRLAEKLIEKGERDRALGTCQVDVIEGQRIGDRECVLYQITHPQPKDGFDFHIAQVFVDVERQIPLRYAAFLWPKSDEEPPLEEEYTFLDVELNVGLTEADFSPENPNYDFP